jgi:signal transduction histidine kinase
MPKLFNIPYFLLLLQITIKATGQTATPIQTLFLQAEKLFNAHKYEAASNTYARVYTQYSRLSNLQQQNLLVHWGGCLYVLAKNDSAMLISNRLLNLSNITPTNLYNYNQRVGIIYVEKGDFNNGLSYLLKAEDINQKYNLNFTKAQINLAFLYLQKHDLSNSLKYNLKAHQIATKQKDTLMLAIAMANIAGIYDINNDLEKAEKEYIKTLNIYKKAQLNHGISQCYQGLTTVYFKKKQYNKGIYYTLQEIEYDIRNQDDYNLAYAYYNLAIGYKELKQFDKIQPYITLSRKKMLQAFETVDNINLSLNIGELQMDINQYAQAQSLFEETLILARKSGVTKYEVQLYKLLSDVYEKQQRHELSNKYLRKFILLKDSLQSIDKETINQELLKKYELSEKEQELTQQKLQLAEQHNVTQHWILYFVLAILICGILIGLVFYNRFRYQQKINQAVDDISAEIQFMKNQFESSNTIQHKHGRRTDTPKVSKVIETLASFEEQMIQKLQSSTSFNYLVSHELRRSLRQIEDNLKLFDNKLGATEKVALQHSINSVSKLDMLVKELLSLAELENKPLYKSNCNLNDLIAEVKDDIHIPNNCQIETDTLPTIEADVLLMKQVFANLLSNAIKYSANTKSIYISIKTRLDGQLYIDICDNGVGFDESLKGNLFKPFHRLHSNFVGTGVGLVVVKTIITKHDGDVFAYNNPNGIGATFGFTLPLSAIV